LQTTCVHMDVISLFILFVAQQEHDARTLVRRIRQPAPSSPFLTSAYQACRVCC
jgi:hypothetical protein